MRKPSRFGRYLLLDRVAVGGMAEVFAAKAFGPEGFQRLLAIKKILPTMSEDREFIHMFVDEARIAVQLAHPNIVRVLELGKHEDSLYIAMEYISGRDLRQVMERFRKHREPMPAAQVCAIAARVCDALDYAHQRCDASGRPLGIVHRDVSPQNVLVGFDGEVKLIDFGIAKAESRLQKTQSGILKGKFSYMSPEQVQGRSVDARSDVFACGVLLWEMLAGEKLFVGDSDFVVLEKIRSGTVPPLPDSCPAELRSVVVKALAVDPAQRHQTAGELHAELSRFGTPLRQRELAEWMQREFHPEWQREQERVALWLSASSPDVTTVDLVPAGADATRVLVSAEDSAQDVSAKPRGSGRSRVGRDRWVVYALAPAAALVVATLLVAALEAEAPQGRGKLVVTRTPLVDAELMVDGKPAGALPAVRNLRAGTHHIEVRASGFKPFSADVEVPGEGRPVEVEARLSPDGPMQLDGLVGTPHRGSAPLEKK